METKKKLSLMLTVIMLLQIILPIVTIIWESGFTIKSIAADINNNNEKAADIDLLKLVRILVGIDRF